VGVKSNKKARDKGYLSNTTNTFQFGIKGRYNWVGEDILLLKTMDPIYYSAIAMGKVIALEISKVDIMTKMPATFVRNLEKAS
jgi:hypothetical protein